MVPIFWAALYLYLRSKNEDFR